jgi:hypothetical protein
MEKYTKAASRRGGTGKTTVAWKRRHVCQMRAMDVDWASGIFNCSWHISPRPSKNNHTRTDWKCRTVLGNLAAAGRFLMRLEALFLFPKTLHFQVDLAHNNNSGSHPDSTTSPPPRAAGKRENKKKQRNEEKIDNG